MCAGRGIKILVFNFGVLPPKILEPKNLDFNFSKYSLIALRLVIRGVCPYVRMAPIHCELIGRICIKGLLALNKR